MQQTKLSIDDLHVLTVLFDLDYICLISHLPHHSTSRIASDIQSLYISKNSVMLAIPVLSSSLVLHVLLSLPYVTLWVSSVCLAFPRATLVQINPSPPLPTSGWWIFLSFWSN